MNKQVLIAIGVFILAIAVGFVVSSPRPNNKPTNTARENTEKVVIHKSPTCGCCGAYGSYLRGLGYDTEINETEELAQIKERLGVPTEVQSCHTMEIGDYVVEGHIPEEAIAKLLSEKPDIKGIGLAGMPQGAPGMPGKKTEDFAIYEINHDGTVGDIFVTL